jgi:hypothetical protein
MQAETPANLKPYSFTKGRNIKASFSFGGDIFEAFGRLLGEEAKQNKGTVSLEEVKGLTSMGLVNIHEVTYSIEYDTMGHCCRFLMLEDTAKRDIKSVIYYEI